MLKVPEGQCRESAFFAASLSQHLELFLTLVHLTEHHHQYFTTVSTCQIISAWERVVQPQQLLLLSRPL